MSTSERGASVRPGVMLALVGGLLAAAGSPLPWLKASVNSAALGGGGLQSKTANGFDGDGWITLVAGIIVVVVAGIMWMRKGSGKGLSALVSLGGLVAGGTGLYDMLTAKDTVINDAVSKVGTGAGISVEQVKAFLNQAFDKGIIKISPELGIFVVIAGGVLALIGGLMLLAAKAKPATAAVSAVGAVEWPPPAAPSSTAAPEPPAPTMPATPEPPTAPAPTAEDPPAAP